MINEKSIRQARWIATGMSADYELQKFIIKSRKRDRMQGMTTEAFLTGLILTIQEYGHCKLNKVADVLDHLPIHIKAELGINSPVKPALYRFNSKLTKCLDFSPDRAPDLTEEERLWRKNQLADLCDQLLASTHIPRPAGSEDYAIDSSGFWANKIGNSNDRDELPPEDEFDHEEPSKVKIDRSLIDSAWGYKSAKRGGRETFFGYDIHAIVRVPRDPRTNDEPVLIESMTLTPAGSDIVEPSLTMIDRILKNGRRIRFLIADRHYSAKKTLRWMKPLRSRGIMPVFDMNGTDQGFRLVDGIPWAAGHPHCPRVPAHLGNIPTLSPAADTKARLEFEEKIAQREAYRAKGHTQLNSELEIRATCPALDFKLGCSLRPGTVKLAEKFELPIISNPPDLADAPKLCTQKTVKYKMTSVRELVVIKTHQFPVWGTQDWFKNYRRRAFVEGMFGTVKETVGLRRRAFLVSGLPMTQIVVTLYFALANARHYNNWCIATGAGDPSHPLTPDMGGHAQAA